MTRIIDLTTAMTDGDPTMPMDPKLSISWHCSLDTLGYNLSRVTMSTHQGTHIDAPKHFFHDGEAIDQIDLKRVIVRTFKADLSYKKAKEPIMVEDLLPYEDKLDQGLCVLLYTGWDKQWPKASFFSDFPYVTKILADWLAGKCVGLIGMDMPTPNGQDWKYVHETLLGANVLIVEGMANMECIQNKEFIFCALPLKLKGRDGSPVRAIAIED